MFDVDAAGCLLPSLVCSGRHLDLRKVAGLKAEGDSPFAYFWWVHPRKMRVYNIVRPLSQTHVLFSCI